MSRTQMAPVVRGPAMNPLKKEGPKIYLNEGLASANGHAAQPCTILPDLITSSRHRHAALSAVI